MPDSLLATLFPDASFLPVNDKLYVAAREHLDRLTKPVGSLGELERVATRLYAINGGRTPIRVDPALLYIVAGDHGIAARDVSPYPQAITRRMAANFLEGGAASNVICRASRIHHRMIDAGCAGEPFAPHPLLLDRRLGSGTADITLGPAMSVATCEGGLRAGFALSLEAAQNGYALLATGEIGIANSSSAAALFCALLGLKPEDAVGPGAGAPPAMIARKTEMIHKALEANAQAIESGNPVRILAAVGGFELVILAGLMLGCASQRLPFVVDGYICASAYAAARALFAPISDYAFFSHQPAEPGFARAFEKLAPLQTPLLNLAMRLGEGTGAALAIPILRSAAAIYNEMATFETAARNAERGK
ncbi:MAG: nicotinate-nucleotide--dimethylbenzimidazole phosphoribosyltransferase [Desulfovibrio sp.]|nr:nicotinate-nucleotide--dimethylbenzimidazole phosphoribosyltransferase [Desulfovibrio sp.]